jgi:hypothetical protein
MSFPVLFSALFFLFYNRERGGADRERGGAGKEQHKLSHHRLQTDVQQYSKGWTTLLGLPYKSSDHTIEKLQN